MANRSDFIEMLVKGNGFTPKEAHAIIDGFIKAVTDSLARGDRVTFTPLGYFTPTVLKQRLSYDPSDREPVVVPASIKVTFSPSESLFNALN